MQFDRVEPVSKELGVVFVRKLGWLRGDSGSFSANCSPHLFSSLSPHFRSLVITSLVPSDAISIPEAESLSLHLSQGSVWVCRTRTLAISSSQKGAFLAYGNILTCLFA